MSVKYFEAFERSKDQNRLNNQFLIIAIPSDWNLVINLHIWGVTISDTGQTKFHLCVCNVGDSLAYVYSGGQVRANTINIITMIATIIKLEKYSELWNIICKVRCSILHPLLAPLCYIHLILCYTIISIHPCSLVLLRSYCKYTTGSRGNSGKPRHHGQPGHEGRPRSPRPCWRTQPWTEQPDLQVKISKGMCAISTLVSV